MRLDELLAEMPKYIPKEMPSVSKGIIGFVSDKTITDVYDLVHHVIGDGKTYSVFLANDKSNAFIGERRTRHEDGASGYSELCTADLKRTPNVTYDEIKPLHGSVLQIDGVEAVRKRRGIGYLLYIGLLEAGYTIISDNVQYLGGRVLWEKIVRLSNVQGLKLYVIQDGKTLKDEAGKPIEYDGDNVDNDEIWSENSNKHLYTVLVAMKSPDKVEESKRSS